jgi:hypothetical protein
MTRSEAITARYDTPSMKKHHPSPNAAMALEGHEGDDLAQGDHVCQRQRRERE